MNNERVKKAIILSAGKGTRLYPLTVNCPKALIPVMNVPIIKLILQKLKYWGIKKIGINLHHLHNLIEEFLKNKCFKDFSFYLAFEPEILGTGGGMANFAQIMEGEECFLLHNCDVICDFDFKALKAFHHSKNGIATLLLVDNPSTNKVFIGKDYEIVDIYGVGAEHLKEGVGGSSKALTYSGIAIFSPRIFQYLPAGRYSSIIEILLYLIKNKIETVYGFIQEKIFWKDIGSIHSYFSLHKDIFSGKVSFLPCIPVFCNNVLIGAGSIIEDITTLDGFNVIGKNCFIGKGVVLKNCILWDDIRLEYPYYKESAIITKDVVVSI